MKNGRTKITVIHPADVQRFRPGGMFGAPRWFKDGDGGGGGGGGGGGATDWKTGIPEDLRTAHGAALEKFKDPGALFKSYIELEGYRGNSLRIPGPDASDADRAEFTEKLKKGAPSLVELPKDEEKLLTTLRERGALPKEAKEYQSEGITFEPGAELSADEISALQQEAAAEGLSRRAFKARVEKAGKMRAAAVRAVTAEQGALKQEWGAAYEDRMREVAVVADKLGFSPALKEAIATRRIDKATALSLHGLVQRLGIETREVAGQGRGGSPTMTPDEARSQQREALKKANDPAISYEERVAAMKRVGELERFIDPDLANYQAPR